MIHNKSYMLCRHMLLTCGGDGEQVFPTMLDAAGATDTVPSGHQIDGMSLLCLLKDPSGASCSGCTSATGCAADTPPDTRIAMPFPLVIFPSPPICSHSFEASTRKEGAFQ